VLQPPPVRHCKEAPPKSFAPLQHMATLLLLYPETQQTSATAGLSSDGGC
jgi:hypothetical protein